MFRFVLLLAVVLNSAQSASVPSFRYSYSEPQGQIAQFYSGADDAFIYNWGYQYPGQSHSESKTRAGVVQGEYSFVDANGEVQQASYRAAPVDGFTVDLVSGGQVQPLIKSFEAGTQQAMGLVPQYQAVSGVPQSPQYQAVSGVPQAVPYTQEHFRTLADEAVPLDVGTEQTIARASPLVLRAVREGKLVPVLGYDNEVVFRVADSLVDDAQGSVSQLAYLLDVDTIAPRRDQQVPLRPMPSFYSANTEEEEATIRGSLDTEFFTDGPAYIVRIPLN